jgi:uncharacterized protein YbjT (DUF2867 family)
MKIVIVGGTGLIGTKTANLLRNAGHEVVQSSPSTGVDTLTGKGLDEVLAGANVVIDVTNSPSFEPKAVLDFFETSGRNIIAAEKRAGVGHHVALSIVNTDRPPGNGYFHAKVAQEKVVKSSGVPYTIVRATQFFEFVRAIAQESTKGTTVRISPANVQFIAADDLAAAVAKAAQAAPVNATYDIAGPERVPFDKLVGRWLKANNDPRSLVTDPDAPYFGAKIDNQTLVPLGDARLGAIRFDDWLKISLVQA